MSRNVISHLYSPSSVVWTGEMLSWASSESRVNLPRDNNSPSAWNCFHWNNFDKNIFQRDNPLLTSIQCYFNQKASYSHLKATFLEDPFEERSLFQEFLFTILLNGDYNDVRREGWIIISHKNSGTTSITIYHAKTWPLLEAWHYGKLSSGLSHSTLSMRVQIFPNFWSFQSIIKLMQLLKTWQYLPIFRIT